MMREQFNIVFQIWMQVWWMLSNNASKKKIWIYTLIFPLLGLGAGIVTFFLGNKPHLGWLAIPLFPVFGLALNLVIIFFIGFIYLCNAVRLHYSPANAKLVPHLKRHLQLALAVPMIIFPIIALVVQSVIASQWRIEAFGMTSFFMLCSCFGIRSPWGLALFVISMQLPRFFADKATRFEATLTATDFKIYFIVMINVMTVIVLRWIFSMNEKEIYNIEKRSLSFKGILNQNAIKNTNFMSRFFNSPYLVWMNYRLKRVNKFNQNNKSSLQIFGLSPNVHWINSFFMVLSISLGMLIVLGGLELLSANQKFEMKSLSNFSQGFLSVMIPLGSLLYSLNFSIALYTSRHEHGLIQLAPMGKNLTMHAQNRLLMLTFVRQFFTLWTIGFTLSLLMGVLVEASKSQMFVILLANLCVLFPSLAIFYKQNKRQSINDHKSILFTLLGIVLFGLSCLVLYSSGDIGVWVCAVVLLMLYGFLVNVFWFQCMDQSKIFPAGRSA